MITLSLSLLKANPDGSATADGPVQLGRFKVRPVLPDAGGRQGDNGTQMDGRRSPTNDNRLLVDVMTEHNAIMTARMESLERAVLISGKNRQSNVNTGQTVGSSGRDFHSKGSTTTADNEVCMLGALSTLADRMKTEMENVQCRISNMSIELRALKSKVGLLFLCHIYLSYTRRELTIILCAFVIPCRLLN